MPSFLIQKLTHILFIYGIFACVAHASNTHTIRFISFYKHLKLITWTKSLLNAKLGCSPGSMDGIRFIYIPNMKIRIIIRDRKNERNTLIWARLIISKKQTIIQFQVGFLHESIKYQVIVCAIIIIRFEHTAAVGK